MKEIAEKHDGSAEPRAENAVCTHGEHRICRRELLKRLALAGLVGIAALLAKGRTVEAGWGRCSVCPCRGFVSTPSSQLCSNCGHPYSAHGLH